MDKQELMNYILTNDDFEITMDGVLIHFNSNIIKKILNDQEIVQKATELYKYGLPLSLQGCAKLAIELEKILKEKKK